MTKYLLLSGYKSQQLDMHNTMPHGFAIHLQNVAKMLENTLMYFSSLSNRIALHGIEGVTQFRFKPNYNTVKALRF